MMPNAVQLEITTPSDLEIAMTRVFDAPRELVFDAWTKPELLTRWLGIHNSWTFPICEIDLRVGGSFRWVWRNPDGNEMGVGGVYREIVRPERIVNTEKFDESWYPGEALDTLVLTEEGGRTTSVLTMRLESKDARDGVLASGMETGLESAYARLDELLGSRMGRSGEGWLRPTR
jgi:uncharacterized protein YndB with AHSA1/START domain